MSSALAHQPYGTRHVVPGHALKVAAWALGEQLLGHEARLRRQYLAKRFHRKAPPRQPLQTLNDLAAIPDGTPVVAHMVRSANGASPQHKRRLVSELRLDRGHGDVGHVGKTYGPFAWKDTMASSAWQEVTQYVYFDPGDVVLEDNPPAYAARSEERPMTTERYETSTGGESVCVTVEGVPGVRFESHTDGFGIGWPTALSAPAALKRALAVLPRPDADDQALIIFESNREEEVSAHEVEQVVEGASEPVVLVQVDVGTASLTWSEPMGGDDELRTMSFGDDYYVRSLAGRLLAEMTPNDVSRRVGDLLDEADGAMAAHLRP